MSSRELPFLVQRFFTDHLPAQLGSSPHTVAGYRDTFRILLRYAAKHLRQNPSRLRLEDLDANFLRNFLSHLETSRRNTPRTRNTRLAALRAFFRYVAFQEPAHALRCQQILAIPTKRHAQNPVEYLTPEESAALLRAPNVATWVGRRDHTLLVVAIHTGLRNAELRALACRDVRLGTGAHVRCTGKGRKTRCTPLGSEASGVLEVWLRERGGHDSDPLFPSSGGRVMSADALQRLVKVHVARARQKCPSLAKKRVTPHTLRHTAAMNLLRRGVDLTVIALWLGHESTQTTQTYIHADMQLKERALAKATSSGRAPRRFRPSDALLAFLDGL